MTTSEIPAPATARRSHGRSRKSLPRRVVNRVLGQLARILPGSTTVRPLLHRLRGVDIEGTVFVGDDVYLENEYPECIRIGDGAQIGLRSTLIAHTRGTGTIVIGADVFIGAGCIITAADGTCITIGRGAVIAAGSTISSDVPPNTLIAPERVKAYAQVTTPFTMNTSYQEFRKGLRPLRAHPKAQAPPR